MDLNLTGQQSAYNQVAPKIAVLQTEMEKRKVLWDRLPIEKKKLWVQKAMQDPTKDAVMKIAWQIFKYLRNNFFEDGVDDG
jgi:hypothetical protein